MTSDVYILLSTTQTKYYIDMVHYSDIKLSQFLKSPAHRLLFQQLVQVKNKENIKTQHYWLFAKGIHRRVDWCVTKPSVSCIL